MGMKRVYVPFTDDEIRELDKWGFQRHIRERSQAIRQLVLIALDPGLIEPTAGTASQA